AGKFGQGNASAVALDRPRAEQPDLLAIEIRVPARRDPAHAVDDQTLEQPALAALRRVVERTAGAIVDAVVPYSVELGERNAPGTAAVRERVEHRWLRAETLCGDEALDDDVS